MKKLEIDDMGGTNTRMECLYNRETVTLRHFNDHFSDKVEITTDCFVKLASVVVEEHMHNTLDEAEKEPTCHSH